MATMDEMQKAAEQLQSSAKSLGDRLKSLEVQAAQLAADLKSYKPPAPAPTPPPVVVKPSPTPENVVEVRPNTDLRSLVNRSEPGTKFLLMNGRYRFHDVVPKDDMQFAGQERGKVIIDGRGHENAFHGIADRVRIERMTFEKFDNLGGTKAQNQSPIRGTRSIWHTTPGTPRPWGWVIHNVTSRHNQACGVFLGLNWTVSHSDFYNNDINGIGGALSNAAGATIHNCIVRDNGEKAAEGVYANGGGIKLTSAGHAKHPVTIRNSRIYGNSRGVWGDIGCHNWVIKDNQVWNSFSAGFIYEMSDSVVVRGNDFTDCSTWTNFRNDWTAGAILIAESSNAQVLNNRVIGQNKAGLVARQTKRPARPHENFLDNYDRLYTRLHNVTFDGNEVSAGTNGHSQGRTGAGIADMNSIKFRNNHYVNPENLAFWAGGRKMNWQQWTAAGRR